MLHELDVLEIRHVAELAVDLRVLRDRLLEKVPETGLGEPEPERGPHNPAGALAMDPVLSATPPFVALREAIAALPREIREKLWTVAETGGGRYAVPDVATACTEAAGLSDEAIAARLLDDPDLHDVLHKGLYQFGAGASPGELP